MGADDFFAIVWEVVSELGDANGPTVLLSAGLLAAAVATRRILPALPPSLMVLALALVIAALVDLDDHEIAVVGEVEGGLPSFGVPGSEQATSSISCFPRRHSRSSPSPTSSRPCAPSPRSTATKSTPTVS